MPHETKLTIANDKISEAVRSEVSKRKELFDERDQIMHNLRRRRLMRHTPFVPKSYQAQLGGEKGIKLPIMYRLVQTAVGAVAKKPPLIEVEAFSAADRKAAEEQAKQANLLLSSIDQNSRVPYLHGLYFTLFGDGLGVTKTLPGPWSDYPLPTQDGDESDSTYNQRVSEYVKSFPLPFYTRIVDPLTFYPPLEEFGDGVVIESAWRNTKEVIRSLNLDVDHTGRFTVGDPDRIPGGKPYSEREFPSGLEATVQVDEVWTKDSCAIVIAGQERVFQFENAMGELPYEWGFADPTGVEDPANVGMSVAFPLYYLTPWIDSLVGIMAAWSIMAAPTPYTTQDPVPGVKPTTETAIDTFQPGKMYHFATGRRPGIMQPPDVGAQVTGFLNFLIESADRGGLPALVSGQGVGTRLPALTFQAAFEAATDRLRPATQSAQKILAGTVRKWFNIIGRYEQPIKVNGYEYTSDTGPRTRRWSTIRPADARKGRIINVTLGIDSTQDLIAKGTHAQFMQNSQLWGVERSMKFAGVDNTESERDEIASDTVWRATLDTLAQATMQNNPDLQAALQGGEEGEETEEGVPGPGRNRQGVPAGRGGGRRGNANPTHEPRGQGEG